MEKKLFKKFIHCKEREIFGQLLCNQQKKSKLEEEFLCTYHKMAIVTKLADILRAVKDIGYGYDFLPNWDMISYHISENVF